MATTSPVVKPFAAFQATDIKTALGNLAADGYAVRRRFYEGDHWGDGDDWIGPAPLDLASTDTGFGETWAELERGFTSRNVVAEGVTRHVDGVLGHEPTWGLSPRRPLGEEEQATDAEQALIDAAEAALTVWWDGRGLHDVLRRVTSTLLLLGRAPARLYVPRGRLQPAATPTTPATADTATLDTPPVLVVPANDLATGLDAIFLNDPDPEQAGIITDEDTQDQAAVYIYQRHETQEVIELVYLDPAAGKDALGQPDTVIATFDQDGVRRYPQTFGGRLTMGEATRDPLVTDAVLQLQRAYNLALSILPRNLITGGFLERVLLNAQMPGEWETDANGNRKRFKPAPHHTGAGTTNYVQGADVINPDGSLAVQTPSIQWREPTPVAPTVEGEVALYRALLEEMKQAHVLMNADPGASGISREQARADYVNSLRRTAVAVERLGRWLLETALAMAEAFMGQPGAYTATLRVDFMCRLDEGPVTSDEQVAIMTTVDKGLISEDTARTMLGVPDVEAEKSRIKTQPGARLALLERQFTVMDLAVTAGMSLEDAAVAVDLDPAILKLIREAPPEPATTPDPNAPTAPVRSNGRRPAAAVPVAAGA